MSNAAEDVIRLTIPPKYYRLPVAMVIAGGTLGMFRGGRRESWRFLAEHAHQAPTTVQGWYFYQKTKNYRVLMGGLRGAGADGLRLGLTGLWWVGMEEAMRRIGLDDVREIGAGVGTAGIFAGLCESWRGVLGDEDADADTDRLPWRVVGQTMFLGLLAGTTLRMARYSFERNRKTDEVL